jgi:hypothetical protein
LVSTVMTAPSASWRRTMGIPTRLLPTTDMVSVLVCCVGQCVLRRLEAGGSAVCGCRWYEQRFVVFDCGSLFVVDSCELLCLLLYL